MFLKCCEGSQLSWSLQQLETVFARKARLRSDAPPAPRPSPWGAQLWATQAPAWDWRADAPGFLGQLDFKCTHKCSAFRNHGAPYARL